MTAGQTIFAPRALLAAGWAENVAVTIGADGRIAGVTPGAAAPDGALHLPDGVLLPAPVNLHSHAFQRAMAGQTESRGADPTDSFWTWRSLMYRFLDRMTPDQVEAIAALAFLEMLEAGYAGAVEFHYLHHQTGGAPYARISELADRIIAAADRTGIGLTLAPVLYQQAGCAGQPLQGGQLRFSNTTDMFARLLEAAAETLRDHAAPDAQLAVCAHSLRAVPPDALRTAAGMLPDAPFHIHVAEQEREIDEVLAHTGARPVEWLLANAGVTDRWCLIHCTHMTPAEVTGLAATQAVAGLCPITEASLGDGIFDGLNFARAGGRLGVGTDSNIEISFFGELRMLEYSQRLRDRRRAVFATQSHSTGRVLFDLAAAGGAAAAGRTCGAIEPGAWADLMALDTGNAWMTGARGDQVLDHAIFTAAPQAVTRHLWSAGRHVIRDGAHPQAGAIRTEAMQALRALLE